MNIVYFNDMEYACVGFARFVYMAVNLAALAHFGMLLW